MVEYHLPGYNFCGPGTKLEKRLSRGDKPINALDAACLVHDIAYADTKDKDTRISADHMLQKKAIHIRNRALPWNPELFAEASIVAAAMETEPGAWI